MHTPTFTWLRSAPRHALTLSIMGSALGLAMGGCAYGNTQQVVRAQFASELNCPAAHAESTKLYDVNYKEGRFTVSGCGVIRLYECPADAGLVSYDDNPCTFEVVNSGQPQMAAPVPNAMDEAGDPALDAPALDDDAPADDPEAGDTVAPKPHAKAGGAKSGGKASAKLSVGLGSGN